MITKDMTVTEVLNQNSQARQILLSFRIGEGTVGFKENQTIEKVCIEHGINLEYLLRELNFRKCY